MSPKKYSNLLFILVMGFGMSLLMTLIITYVNTGLDKGYINLSDVYKADSQAFLQGPLEEYKFSYNSGFELSPGGEFIKNAHLTDNYIADGTFNYSDVVDIEMTAQLDSQLIDYLF